MRARLIILIDLSEVFLFFRLSLSSSIGWAGRTNDAGSGGGTSTGQIAITSMYTTNNNNYTRDFELEGLLPPPGLETCVREMKRGNVEQKHK